MASSENLASIEPWMFRTGFADSWISEAFARDTETLTRALQKSISNSFSNSDSTLSPLLTLVNSTASPSPTPTPPATTPRASNVSGGSDPEITATNKRQRSTNSNLPPTGKVSKRKPRASKRSQTTFITADQANFRQMVQHVTGVRFGTNAQMNLSSPILKPEAQRPGNRLPNGVVSGCLPTLDTSAFLLDHQKPSPEAVATEHSLFPFQSSVLTEGVAARLDCDTFPSFPTLESWKV